MIVRCFIRPASRFRPEVSTHLGFRRSTDSVGGGRYRTVDFIGGNLGSLGGAVGSVSISASDEPDVDEMTILSCQLTRLSYRLNGRI